MATLKQVAALAGVSPATASLALNNGPVNEATRSKVAEAARQLAYVPNKLGRMLTTGKSHSIEMVILTVDGYPNIVRQTALMYYLMIGVMQVAAASGYSVRVTSRSHDDADIITYFEHVVADGLVDGIIVIPQFARDYGFLNVLQRAKFPHVLLRPAHPDPGSNYVDMGDYEGGRLVAELLLKMNASRVAIINGPRLHLCSLERERGLAAGLVEAGGRIVARRFGDYTIDSGYAAMRSIVEESISLDAIFCANDYMAAGALNYLRGENIRVPDDIAVVGYDDSDLAAVTDPPLTTLDNRFFDLGQQLASDVIDLILARKIRTSAKILPVLKLRRSHDLSAAKADISSLVSA